jgi:hypothetical protein
MRISLVACAAALVTAGMVAQADAGAASATARLSTFPGIVFSKGSCRRSVVNGVPQFTVKLGTRTQNAETNNGRPYFGLTISGPLSHPTGGGVIAYAHGKRWGGVGVGFHGTTHGGSFVASGIRGSRGHATGTYDCG